MARVFFDTFEERELDPGYRWFDEGWPDRYEISSGWLRISATTGQDLWGGQPLKRGAPLMLRQAPAGDYEVRCFVDARWGNIWAQRINTQVGLFVFQDVWNWLFFGFTNHSSQEGDLPQGDGLIVTSVLEDVARIESYEAVPFDDAPLRIKRVGDWWRFYWKPDRWLRFGDEVFAPFGTHEVGRGVKSFQSGGGAHQGNFDNFEILVP
jgi:hypothetical protein